jgi:urease accessory protein
MASDETPREDDALLQLIWLASPALPIGGFSYSEGLEAFLEAAQAAIKKEAFKDADITQWLVDQLHLSLARSDLAVLAQAVAAFREDDLARIATLNQWVLATRESGELRAQTVQMGYSMVQWLATVQPELPPLQEPLTYPLAFARAAATSQASVRSICLAFAFGWAENMVAAAVKSVPLGQSAGQRMLARLSAEIPQAVDRALQTPDQERQAFSPMLAILSAQHETQYARLFRS